MGIPYNNPWDYPPTPQEFKEDVEKFRRKEWWEYIAQDKKVAETMRANALLSFLLYAKSLNSLRSFYAKRRMRIRG